MIRAAIIGFVLLAFATPPVQSLEVGPRVSRSQCAHLDKVPNQNRTKCVRKPVIAPGDAYTVYPFTGGTASG